MEIIVIACYKPKFGKEKMLDELMKTHLAILHSQNLVTKRDSIMMKAKDGTVIEVFEWISQEAIDKAHTNPVVLEMWRKYAEACDYIPVEQVPEAARLFSGFTPFKFPQ